LVVIQNFENQVQMIDKNHPMIFTNLIAHTKKVKLGIGIGIQKKKWGKPVI